MSESRNACSDCKHRIGRDYAHDEEPDMCALTSRVHWCPFNGVRRSFRSIWWARKSRLGGLGFIATLIARAPIFCCGFEEAKQ